MKSYAPRRIPSRRSVHSTEHLAVFGGVDATALRPRLASTHSVLIWRGVFSFFILYGGGGRGRVSPKEKLTEF